MKLIHGDCLEEMPKLEAGSVDLTVTSPPYDNLRTYNDGLVWNEGIWKRVIENLFWLTKEGGVVVWVVADSTENGSKTGTSFKQALWAMEMGFRLHDHMIYQKPAPSYPDTVRYYSVWENMFIFSKGKPATINLLRDRRNKSFGRKVTGTERKKHGGTVKKPCYGNLIKEFGVRYNVWLIKNQVNNQDKTHPAQFPESLAHDHIVSWSNQGDTVFDPFLGSGTTGKMAKILGRHFIGIEKDPDYFAIAEKRIAAAQPALFTG